MKRILACLSIVMCLLAFGSCKTNNEPTETKVPYSKIKNENKEETIKINHDMLDVNRDVIDKYIERHKWHMTETQTGLFYMIFEKTQDVEVKSGDEVVFSYKTSLLNGDVLYDSETMGNRKLAIDKNQEEAGLNEGLKLMRKGEKAYFIIPPHLAFGVPGDSYKVPPYSVLVYEVQVVDVKSPNDNLDQVVL